MLQEQSDPVQILHLPVDIFLMQTAPVYQKIENPIYFRAVNADGSEIQGTPKIKGVSYTWAENKTILNKKETTKLFKGKVCCIGEGANDYGMFEEADIAIAFGE